VVLALALLKIAVPFALISCYSTPFELKHALKITRATRLFVAPHYLSKATPVLQEVGIPKDRVYVMSSQIDGYGSVEGFVQRAIAMNMSHSAARQVPKDTLAFLFFSSGTTGLPKGKCFYLR
jgi:acyl-CoA synthetase (AMP-forming)/AMP-acid ligase II